MELVRNFKTERIALGGQKAVNWYEQSGWLAEPSSTPFRFFADMSQVPGFTVSRFWLTPVRLSPLDEPEERASLNAILCIDGELTVRTARATFALPPGHIVIHNRDKMHSVEVKKPTSVVSINTYLDRMTGIGHLGSVVERPLRPDEGLTSMVTAAVNAALTNSLDTSGHAFTPWRRSFEYMLMALIDSSEVGAAARSAMSQNELVQRALRVIDERAWDVSFTVSALSDELHTSPSHLHRAFRSTGGSPGKYLRNLRTQLAVEKLRGKPVTESNLRTVALSTGFGSARSLRRALHASKEASHLFPTSQKQETGTAPRSEHRGA